MFHLHGSSILNDINEEMVILGSKLWFLHDIGKPYIVPVSNLLSIDVMTSYYDTDIVYKNDHYFTKGPPNLSNFRFER